MSTREQELEAALADMFALIDEGFLCRSTRLDHEPDWALRVSRGIARMAKAARLLPETSNDSSK